MVGNHDLLGGSILRPLNSSTWKHIPSPFLQIIQAYGDGEYVDYFTFVLWGDDNFTKNDKKYEVHFLSGPQTTKNEYDYLKTQDKWSVEDPGCCMNEKLAQILGTGASRIVISDFEMKHKKVLGVIE